MTRQPHDPDIMAKVLAPELCPYPKRLGKFVHQLFELEVAERVAVLRTVSWKRIEVAAGCKLDRLECQLGGGSADNDCEVIGRASGGTQRQDLLPQERHQPLGGQHGRGRLKEEGLVGRSTTLGNNKNS